MMETKNIKTTMAKILTMAIVLAALVAAMTATAKPAEAATTCNSYAKAPYHKDNANGNRYIYFESSIVCSAPIGGAKIGSFGAIPDGFAPNGNRTYRFIKWNDGWSWESKATYKRTAIYDCGSGSQTTTRYFRTIHVGAEVMALNGTVNSLPSRYSSIAPIKCNRSGSQGPQ